MTDSGSREEAITRKKYHGCFDADDTIRLFNISLHYEETICVSPRGKKLAADFAEATGHPRFFSAPVFHFSAKSASIPRKWRSSFRRRPDSPTFVFQRSEEIIEIHVQLPLSI